MKINTLISALLLSLAPSLLMANTTAEELESQTFGFFSMFHPEVKEPTQSSFVKQFSDDYAALFAQKSKVNQQQFTDYSNSRLESLISKRREMSLKQAYVRFGVINSNKDQHITLFEFQTTGIKTFSNFDQNQDGIINAEDIKLAPKKVGTHDGFRTRTPLGMPMANNIAEFIQMHGAELGFVTLGKYLSDRDAQFFAVDQNQDAILSEQEYVSEFMQRYDANLSLAREIYQDIFALQFHEIANGKSTISLGNIKTHAKAVFQVLDSDKNGKISVDEL